MQDVYAIFQAYIAFKQSTFCLIMNKGFISILWT